MPLTELDYFSNGSCASATFVLWQGKRCGIYYRRGRLLYNKAQ